MIAELSRRTFYDTFAGENTAENMEKFMNEQFTYDALVKEVHAPGNIFIIGELEAQPYQPLFSHGGEKEIGLFEGLV